MTAPGPRRPSRAGDIAIASLLVCTEIPLALIGWYAASFNFMGQQQGHTQREAITLVATILSLFLAATAVTATALRRPVTATIQGLLLGALLLGCVVALT
ncbi:hypothetical protein ACFXG8_33010 [Kitasatospora indigofera]|uniref:hypothetical protein n=2 Tax=Kitasatospora indigofera TaxID=67307 RepID=UPI0036A9EDDB